jgi:dihydroflavonol-4-reductase
MTSPQKILITGASGLLGSQLIHECLNKGIRPICLVRENSDCSFIDSHRLEKRYADLRNQERLSESFSGIDAVIHTAAIVDFRGDKLTLFTGINSFGALFCYRAAVSAGAKKFLHVSTIAAVGANLRHPNNFPAPLTENATFNLDKLRIPYILSKHQAEQLLFQAHAQSDDSEERPKLITVNPSIIVAPSRHGADKSRIDKLMSRAILPNFKTRFNVVDIRDVAQAIIVALEKGEDGERYLLTGDNLSLSEGLKIFSSLTGQTPRQAPLPISILKGVAQIASRLRRKDKGGKLRFYPDIIRMLDYDWVYDNSKAGQRLDFNPRSARETLGDLYSGNFAGFYLQRISD